MFPVQIIDREMCKIVILVSFYWIMVDFLFITYYLGEIESDLSSKPETALLTETDVVETQIEDYRSVKSDPSTENHGESVVSSAYPVQLLKSWRPVPAAAAVAATQVPLEGPGEHGRPVIFNESDAAETTIKRFGEHEFNVIASDAISLNRSVPDFRPSMCKNKRYPALLPATSVIIGFFNEAWSTLLRTIWSVINRSPRSLVAEILLIDDGSELDFLGKTLEEYVATLPVETKIIRKQNRTGIIETRLLGVKHAKSQVITFLDSHCECNDGWLEPLLARIAANRNIVVAPFIDTISDQTFELTEGNITEWGGFDWKLGFKWVEIPQREYDRRNNDTSEPLRSPTISGGLFSIDKDYFFKLGSYDEEMKFWGGDNLDLSFRVWMCGGSIEILPCSRVSHVFRMKSPYPFPGGVAATVGRNLLRVAKVWMDEWKFIHYMYNIGTFDVDIGDVSNRLALRTKLKCKSFRWYLKHIYPEFLSYAGDYFVGQIQNIGTGQCLDTFSHKINETLGMNICNKLGDTQHFGFTPHSLILTEDIYCLGTLDNSGLVKLCKCHLNKSNLMWHYDRLKVTITHTESQQCLEHAQTLASNSSSLVLNPCSDSQNQKWILNLLNT